MNKYAVVAIFVVLVVVAIYSIVQVSMPVMSATVSSVGIGSSVCIYHNGRLIEPCSHNTMTNAGLNWTRDLIGNWSGGTNPMKFIALGNGSTAENSSLTTLPNQINDCGLAIAEGAYAVNQTSSGSWSISKQFTSTCDNIVVNTTALYNQSSSTCGSGGCVMFAGKDFSSNVTLMNNDQLNITWYIWVTGG